MLGRRGNAGVERNLSCSGSVDMNESLRRKKQHNENCLEFRED